AAAAPELRAPILETMTAPIRESVVDLRKMRGGTVILAPEEKRAPQKSGLTKGEFLMKYKLFFLFIAVVLFIGSGLSLYFNKVLVPERTYNINGVESASEEAATTQ